MTRRSTVAGAEEQVEAEITGGKTAKVIFVGYFLVVKT
jgi:hypothetical protein